jgi:hypothetical protein
MLQEGPPPTHTHTSIIPGLICLKHHLRLSTFTSYLFYACIISLLVCVWGGGRAAMFGSLNPSRLGRTLILQVKWLRSPRLLQNSNPQLPIWPGLQLCVFTSSDFCKRILGLDFHPRLLCAQARGRHAALLADH